MRVLVIVDPAHLTDWHADLIRALGPDVRAVRDPDAAATPPRPSSLAALLLLDRTLHSRPSRETPENKPQLVDLPVVPAHAARDARLVIDLSGGLSQRFQIPVWTPLFDGLPGELGLWNALLDGRPPRLSIASTDGPDVVIGLPALETPENLAASAASVTARMVEALVIAAARHANSMSPRQYESPPAAAMVPARRGRVSAAAMRIVSVRAARMLAKLLQTAPKWATLYRPAPAPRMLPSGDLTPSTWHLLADDGHRYYADPFLAAHGGATHLFVEEFPYATGRGIISHTVVGADGRANAPIPVLETPWHLSYPHLIEDDGRIYMLPEASASGGLTLYRAEAFPNRWTPVARLIDRPVHDATIVRHGGRLWLFASTQYGASSSWDALSLWSADRLEGPWRPHPDNPVLLDRTSARPGGELFVASGALYRPAQDMSRGYGSALALARVTRLDDAGYAQETISAWRTPPALQLLGPHTWNRGGGFEAVDLFGATGALTRAASQP